MHSRSGRLINADRNQALIEAVDMVMRQGKTVAEAVDKTGIPRSTINE